MEAMQLQKVVDAISAGKTGIYDLVYFYGDQEAASTILDSIADAYRQQHPNTKIIRMDAEAFRRETFHIIREEIRDAFRYECDLFVLENIEQLAGSEINEQRLYGILDWLLENGRRMIITGASPVAGIRNLAPRICAQLEGGISLCIQNGVGES